MPIPESIEDLVECPSKFGMPTLEEITRKHYSKREAFYGREDEEIAAIDRGDPILGCRQKYYVEGYRVESLEQAERIARDMGLNLFHDFVVHPQLRPDGAASFYNEVTFRSKSSVQKRANW